MSPHYRFAGFELRAPSRELFLDGIPAAIEPKVFDVLNYLVEHRDRAVGRDELIAAVWGRVDVADATLQQAISRLRRVLRETNEAPFVRTVPRHGYQWVAATERVTDAAPAPPVPRAASAPEPPGGAPEPQAAVPQRRGWRFWLRVGFVGALALGLAASVRLLQQTAAERERTHTPAEPTATTGDPASAVPGAPTTQPACAHRAPRDCLQQLGAALSDTTLRPEARAQLLLQRAAQHLRVPDPAAAAADVDTAEEMTGIARLPDLDARALYLRHRVALAGGKSDEAMAFGQRALALYRGQGNSDDHAELLHSLGTTAGREGELERALAWLDAARHMYIATRNDEGASRVLATTAYTLSQLGRFADSLATARLAQARAPVEAAIDVRREAMIALAWASIQNGRLRDAREAVHNALALPSADDNSHQAVSLRSLLGFIDAAGGRFREALTAWDDALAHTAEGSRSAAVAGLRLAIVYAALNVDDRERARSQFHELQQMAAAAAEFRQPAVHAAALLAAAEGDDGRAAKFFAEAWAAARDSGSLNQQMLADYADVLLRRGELDTLETLLGEPSLPASEGHLYQLVQARYLAHRGRRDDAQAAFDRARNLAGERYSRWLDVARREVTGTDTLR